MKIRVQNINDILDDKLSLLERGLLITILLSKDIDPKITLAKVKVRVKMIKVRRELMNLHELGFIEWSGYNRAKKNEEDKEVNPKVVEVIDFMNELYGRGFDSKSTASTKNLINRLNDHSVEDIKMVVANRWEEWNMDSVMNKHLTPHTIFRPSKFDKYLEEALRTRKGEGLVEAKKIGLKQGDEITLEIAQTLIEEEMYNIRIYRLDPDDGRIMGNGTISKRTGKAIMKAIKIQENNFKYGTPKEYIYKYRTR